MITCITTTFSFTRNTSSKLNTFKTKETRHTALTILSSQTTMSSTFGESGSSGTSSTNTTVVGQTFTANGYVVTNPIVTFNIEIGHTSWNITTTASLTMTA